MGFLQSITSPFKAATSGTATQALKPDVIVIGAGVSGLSCAESLIKAGRTVLVLEARDRIGGRTHTYTDPTLGFPLDLGGSFIHGLAGNPLTKLANEHKLKLYTPEAGAAPGPPLPAVWGPEGPLLDKDLASRISFNSMRTFFETSESIAQEQADSLPNDTGSLASYILDEKRSTLFEGLETAEHRTFAACLARAWDGWIGAGLDKTSLKYWQADVTYGGPDATIVDGYKGIYEPMAAAVRAHRGSTIKLSSEVTAISYDEDEGQISVKTKQAAATESEEKIQAGAPQTLYTAPYVVCTLPLGVLQKRSPDFSPPLSLRRTKAINRLGMGLLNKIIVTYSSCFWPKESPFLVFMPSKASIDFTPILKDRALMAQNYHLVKGQNTLVFYLGGEAGEELEKLSDEQVSKGIHSVLEHHFPRRDGAITEEDRAPEHGPKSCIVTRWLADPYSQGSYAYVRSAKQGEEDVPTPYDFAELARPTWDDHLFFAGEATDPDHYATVHGPLITGRKEAQRVLDAMEAAKMEK